MDQTPLIEEKRLVATLMSGRPSIHAFVMATLTVLIMMLVTVFFWRGPENLTDLLPAIHVQIFENHQWWRIFTAIFIHANIEHLFSNMYMLWIFTFFVFGYFGFGVFPILSLIVAAIVNVMAILTYAPQVELLGASGLVYVLGGFWLTLYFFIQRQFTLLNRFIRVFGISIMIFWPSTFVASTSYRTHAIGFFAGLVMALIYFYFNREDIRKQEIYQIDLV